MKNNIDTVNEALFDTLKKLQTGDIKIENAKAIVEVSTAIAKNSSLQLQAFKLTKGKTEAPKTLLEGKVYATSKNGDTHSQKTEFAQSLGYKGVVEAIEDLGSYKFNQQFKEKFN